MWESKSVQVAVSSYYSLVSLNNRHLLSCHFGDWKSMFKVLSGWMLVRVPFPASRQLPLTMSSLWCVCRAVWEGRRETALCASSNKNPVLSGSGPTFLVSFYLNCFLRVLSPDLARSEG